ncbi:AAA family ATPase [Hymenobacter nivis]|uniref:Endonuclease GajA/Old nuclease/RecF-like AAA domain-containing protein n=1 Tax=Hymenobacter nivis TaxID=1850093 RepID=A0A2Z3GIV4_9BACT|nr:AAA family ATPase [Hymenobacter nivis]AWM33693.1 hypothetical protein DDQ68_13405 [Hymenobacter nivis]
MNEQLIVKNFGPIKDATVDFKRVTVFIGPTGGGKSTLAKLAAVFRDKRFYADNDGSSKPEDEFKNRQILSIYSINKYFNIQTQIEFQSDTVKISYANEQDRIALIGSGERAAKEYFNYTTEALTSIRNILAKRLEPYESKTKGTGNEQSPDIGQTQEDIKSIILNLRESKVFSNFAMRTKSEYIPAERAFLSAIEYSWAGLIRDNIGLPKILLDFANSFSLSRKDVSELDIPFLKAKYLHVNGRDFIKIPDREEPLMLLETASGIQSVTPMLVLLEHLSRNTEQAQSFIIEEPELNLYPTAQQGLLNWLVEKCTKGENDLTITTHSPYILSHLNLLLYAYHVGSKDEEKRQKVAVIIPEKYWINPDEFAAYYVNGPEGAGGVRSLLDPETKLISQNELDAVSGIQADEFDQLLDINRGF